MNVIQIGCQIGNDSVFRFYKKYYKKIDKMLAIDANKYGVDICKAFYQKNLSQEAFKKVVFLTRAIVDQNLDEIDFFIPDDSLIEKMSYYSAFSSTNPTHLSSHGVPKIKKISIPCSTVEKLVSEYQLNKIDRLFIDAEGLDAKIILAINFNKINIPFICFEQSHVDGPFTKGQNWIDVISKLKRNQYKVFGMINPDGADYNVWAIKNDKLKEEIMEFRSKEKSYLKEI